MTISIASPFRPFSHQPGAVCLLPKTNLLIRAFPDGIEIGDLKIPLPAQEGLKGFTLQQDLERQSVFVFSNQYKVEIKATPEGIVCNQDFLFKAPSIDLSPLEKISFGSHKKQEVTRDFDLRCCREINFRVVEEKNGPDFEYFLAAGIASIPVRENIQQDGLIFPSKALKVIFLQRLRHNLPFLYLLSQMVPEEPFPDAEEGAWKIAEWSSFCQTGFSPFFVPQTPSFFPSLRKRLKASFCIQTGHTVHLLPAAPLFPSGRMTGIQIEGIGELCFDWRKNALFRAHLWVKESGFLEIFVGREKRGVAWKKNGKGPWQETPSFFEKGNLYWLK